MSALKTKNRLTDDERAADREYVKQAVETLRTSDGWQRWLRTRSSFRTYSFTNQLLISVQAPDARRVAGFKKWLTLGYCVRKGEKAIRIYAPVPPSKKVIEAWKAAGSPQDQKPRTHFRLTAVFGDHQVAELPPPSEPAPLEYPAVMLEGDELAPHLAKLEQFAGTIGSALTYEPITDQSLGYYRPSSKAIVVKAGLPVNQTTSVLCHELAHALVRHDRHPDDPALNYDKEELVAESVAFTVLRSLGVDADATAIPYLTGWVEDADLDVFEKLAALVDRLANSLLDAAGDPGTGDASADAVHPDA